MSKENALKDVNFGELFTSDVDDNFEVPSTLNNNEISETKDNLDEDKDVEIIPFNIENKKEEQKSSKEETTKKEDEKKEEHKESPSHKDTNDSSLSLVFAKFLNEKGLLSNYDEEKFSEYFKENGDENSLEYLFNSELEARVEEIKNTYADDMKEYVELKDAGINGNLAQQLVSLKSTFDSIKDEDIESNEDLRKQILVQHYMNTTNFSENKIKKIVEKFINDGDDIDEAKEALIEIKKFNEEQIKLEKKKVEDEEKYREEQIKKNKEEFSKTLYGTKEILGQSVNKPTLQKLERFLEPVYKDDKGNSIDGITAWFLKDPIKARINLAYGIMSGLLDGKLDKLEQKAKTNAINEMEKIFNSKGMVTGFSDTKTENDIKNNLTNLKNTFGDLDVSTKY